MQTAPPVLRLSVICLCSRGRRRTHPELLELKVDVCMSVQAWRRLLGQHNDTAQAAPSEQPAIPSVHQLTDSSAFASSPVPTATPDSANPHSTPQPCVGTPPPNRGSQRSTLLGSHRLSSAGPSTQGASPHRTRITSDTAKSHRSMDSVPASEIQWLLQAMGSALAPADLGPPVTPDGTRAPVNTFASPVTPTRGNEGCGRPWANGGSSHGGSRDRPQNGAMPAPSHNGTAADPGLVDRQDSTAPSKGLHVAVEDVLGWDEEQQEVSDHRCEELLMTILQESAKVDADVEVRTLKSSKLCMRTS